MRILVAAIVLALMVAGALAQGIEDSGKGRKSRQNAATKTEDVANKKADEDAYKKALQSNTRRQSED